MTVSGNVTWKASLVGSVVGIVAWLLGLGNDIWPAHPQLALLLLTLIATMVMMGVWSKQVAKPQVSGPDR
jgi:hypothetical protein